MWNFKSALNSLSLKMSSCVVSSYISISSKNSSTNNLIFELKFIIFIFILKKKESIQWIFYPDAL